MQGKTYTTDPITHKRVINMGEENQYYIKEHHTAIIEPELFEKVQQILEKRAGSRSKGKRRGNYSRKYPFSSRIYCGFCGTVLTRRNWNSKTKNETPVWHCMNFVKRGKQECPKCKAMRETVIENCFVDAYKILCSNKGDIVNKFITRINSIITENSSSKLIENIETEKEKLKSKMNKLIDLSLENAIDRETFLERKEKIQNQIEQLNLKQEKLVLDERNKTNRKLSLNKLKRYLENGEIITEFDKDAFEILVKQVIIGGYDEKDKADPKQITFVLKNETKINYEDYLQTSNDIHEKNLQMSDHTCGVCSVDRVEELPAVIELTSFQDTIMFHKRGRCGLELEEILKELHIYNYISKNDIENIIYSCANLGFCANIAEQKELSVEGKIAQDADRLDAIGAVGIARTFAYGGKKGKSIYDPYNNELVNEEEYKQKGSKTSISHFYDKLLKIKDLMNTDTAKIIAQERHKYLEDFLQEFFEKSLNIKNCSLYISI